MMDMMQMNGMGGGTMMIVWILLWVLLIAGAVWLVWQLVRGRTGGDAGSPGESAEDVLKKRYARGEIDRTTYERMLDDLRSGPGGAT